MFTLNSDVIDLQLVNRQNQINNMLDGDVETIQRI